MPGYASVCRKAAFRANLARGKTVAGHAGRGGTGWGVRIFIRSCNLVLELFAGERARWALWLPVLFGVGIAFYFTLPEEPAVWVGAAALSAAFVSVVLSRRHMALQIVAWGAVVLAGGMTLAQFRTHWVAAPVLEKKISGAWVEGRVVRAQQRPNARRIWLDRLKISRLAPAAVPQTIRLRIGLRGPELRPGDTVSLRAVLYPPPGPAAPGAFDFARRAYFERLGGVGYAISKLRRGEAADSGLGLFIARMRNDITRRVRDALPGTAGAVAAALMTGERGAIPEQVMEAMRGSGLAHLLAISGLHIGLVGGILFFVIRLFFAGWERVALRYPIKKWSAIAAMAGGFAYLLLSGATVPTQRAFLMLLAVLTAVVLDRNPISMRLVAWAAVAVMLIAPESVLSVSFQMSFAAVVALVAVYEASFARASLLNPERLPRPLLYLGGVMLTTLVAGLATAPFAAYHFNRVALYGIAANLVAIPLTGMWIMPWALFGFMLMPFGLEALALAPMGWGIDVLVAVATFFAGLPNSVALVPAMPGYGLALAAVGGLWLCLWRRRWRFAGLAPIVAGMLTIALVRPPHVLVDDAAKQMAVRDGNGGLILTSSRRLNFRVRTWLRRMGQDENARPSRKMSAAGGAHLSCDALGCIYRAAGHTVALVKHRAALEEDCRIATVVISRVPVARGKCRGPLAVIDRFKLWREGAHAVWLEPGKVRIESVADAAGARPWSSARSRSGRGKRVRKKRVRRQRD